MAAFQLTRAEKRIGRWGIAICRAALARSEFPEVDRRHQVDQALATTRAVRP